MSTKKFCDCCGVEITEKNDLRGAEGDNSVSRWRLGGKVDRLSFEILTAIDGTWNAGEVCRYCVIDAVRSLDDRAVPAMTDYAKLADALEAQAPQGLLSGHCTNLPAIREAAYVIRSLASAQAGMPTLPEPDLLVDCAQSMVKGWTASTIRAYAAQHAAAIAAERSLLTEWEDGLYDGADFLRRVLLALHGRLKNPATAPQQAARQEGEKA